MGGPEEELREKRAQGLVNGKKENRQSHREGASQVWIGALYTVPRTQREVKEEKKQNQKEIHQQHVQKWEEKRRARSKSTNVTGVTTFSHVKE